MSSFTVAEPDSGGSAGHAAKAMATLGGAMAAAATLPAHLDGMLK